VQQYGIRPGERLTISDTLGFSLTFAFCKSSKLKRGFHSRLDYFSDMN
jgi:hypothetical protein